MPLNWIWLTFFVICVNAIFFRCRRLFAPSFIRKRMSINEIYFSAHLDILKYGRNLVRQKEKIAIEFFRSHEFVWHESYWYMDCWELSAMLRILWRRQHCMHNFTWKLASDWICIEIEFAICNLLRFHFRHLFAVHIRRQFLLIIAQFDTNSIYANFIFSETVVFLCFLAAFSISNSHLTIIANRNDQARYSWASYKLYIFHAIYYAKGSATFFLSASFWNFCVAILVTLYVSRKTAIRNVTSFSKTILQNSLCILGMLWPRWFGVIWF